MKQSNLFAALIFTLFFILTLSDVAFGFSFIMVKPGQPLPDLSFRNYNTSETDTFGSRQGTPTLFVFWGADIPEKEQRSIETLKAMQKNLDFFKQRNIRVLAVEIQDDPAAKINRVLAQADISFPMYVDPDEDAFNILGTYTIPSVLFVTADGKIAAGIGYSKKLPEMVIDSIRTALNEKTEEELQKESEAQEKTRPERMKAELRYKYSLNLIGRHKDEEAEKVLRKAVKLDPKYGPAHIELGCLMVETGKLDEAKRYIGQGLYLEPRSDRGKKCLEKLYKKLGS